jgi:hypothetical protein
MVQKRPMQASARKAPMSGVAAEVPPKLVSVVAALASGMCSCVVRYVSMLVENPTTASFSATSLAARVQHHLRLSKLARRTQSPSGAAAGSVNKVAHRR